MKCVEVITASKGEECVIRISEKPLQNPGMILVHFFAIVSKHVFDLSTNTDEFAGCVRAFLTVLSPRKLELLHSADKSFPIPHLPLEFHQGNFSR